MKTTNILLSVIIILLGTQIILTIDMSSNLKEYQKEKLKPQLPVGLRTDEQKLELFNEFKKYYNNKDYDALYSWFDESVRVQFTKEKVIQTTNMLHNNIGDITNGAFTYFEPEPANNGLKMYVLYYTLKTTKGVATLKVNILQQNDDNYKKVGFTIVGN